MVPNDHNIQRVQTGLRIDRKLLKVLKAIAADREISLAALIEAIILNALDGKKPFSPEARRHIAGFKALYGLDRSAADAVSLREDKAE